MGLLSIFAHELQDLWYLFFPLSVLDDEEDEPAFPIGVETSSQRILSIIQQGKPIIQHRRPIIQDPKELIPPIDLGPAALPSVQDRGTVNFIIKHNAENCCNIAQQSSILSQITALSR